MVNAVESDYFSALDHMGKRRDLQQRPELMFGSGMPKEPHIARKRALSYPEETCSCSAQVIHDLISKEYLTSKEYFSH